MDRCEVSLSVHNPEVAGADSRSCARLQVPRERVLPGQQPLGVHDRHVGLLLLDAARKASRRVAAELIGDLEWVHRRQKAADKELKQLIEATASSLMSLPGFSSRSATSPAS